MLIFSLSAVMIYQAIVPATRVSAILGRQCFVVLLAVEGLDFSLKMTQCYFNMSRQDRAE